jgi:hypothetical protein
MAKFTLPEGVTPKAKKFHERESAIEEYLVKRTKSRGEIAYKFTSPQRRSVPDRLVLGDADQMAAELDVLLYKAGVMPQLTLEKLREITVQVVERGVCFVELKATGQKPTELQEREHEKLRARGFTVRVIDNKEVIDRRWPK